MKIATSLLLLSAGLSAYGQNPNLFRRNDRVEGVYEALQRDDTVRRALTLDRGGRAELVTEVRRNDRSRDRRKWDRDDDTKSYGTLAEEASEGRPVRHTGRWSERDGKIRIRLDDRSDVRGQESAIDMELVYRDGAFVFDRDSKVYGRAKINFRRDGGWGGGRGNQGSRFGSVRYDRDELDIDTLELIDRGRDSRLVIRAGRTRIELRGDARRRGEEVIFVLPSSGIESGEFSLRMRGGQIESIRGRGMQDRHRIDFDGRRGRS